MSVVLVIGEIKRMHVILVPHLALGLGSEKEQRLLLVIVSKFLNHSAIRKQVRAENAEF
jgi:hypothetical protein